MPEKSLVTENFVSYKAFLSILLTVIGLVITISALVYNNHAGEPHRDAVSKRDLQLFKNEVKADQRELKQDLEKDISEIKSYLQTILEVVMEDK